MKQGAVKDPMEFVQPWTVLFLNFFMENTDKEESQGSFKPLNMGFGWIDDSKKENNKRETCQETYISSGC